MLSIHAEDPRAVAVVAAIHSGDVETLQRQLQTHPDLATAKVVDTCGVARPLLHIAADWPGHFPNGPQTVAALIAAGADVNARVEHPGPQGSPETALHWAASSDDVGVLDALLDGGADIEAPGAVFTGGTAMSDAVVFAQWRAARRLVARGATTTIWQAAALGLLDRVRECCSTQRPSTREITNAFWHACRGGQQAAAEYLLDRGADQNWLGHDGKTPFDVAEECGEEKLIELLRGRGALRAAELQAPRFDAR
jgi:ankyrin repeat protein